MTGRREVTRYATPSLRRSGGRLWSVHAHPWNELVGTVWNSGPVGWTATTKRRRYAGLWPTKQAAAEVLVKQAGYELEMS